MPSSMKKKMPSSMKKKMPSSMKKKMSPKGKKSPMRKKPTVKKVSVKRKTSPMKKMNNMMEENPGTVSTGAKVGVMGVGTGAGVRMGSPKKVSTKSKKGKKMSVKSKKGKKMSVKSKKGKKTRRRMNGTSASGLNPDAEPYDPNAAKESRFFDKDGNRMFEIDKKEN